jgi:hypothetical protein
VIGLLLDFWLMLPTAEPPKNIRQRNLGICSSVQGLILLLHQPSELLAKKAALLIHRLAYFAPPAQLQWYFSTVIHIPEALFVPFQQISTFKYPHAMALICKFLAKIGAVKFRAWQHNELLPFILLEAMSISFAQLTQSLVNLRKDPTNFLSSWILETKKFHEMLQFIDPTTGEVRSQRPIPLYDLIEKAINQKLREKSSEKASKTPENLSATHLPSTSLNGIGVAPNGTHNHVQNDGPFQGFIFANPDVNQALPGSGNKFKIPPPASKPGPPGEHKSVTNILRGIEQYCMPGQSHGSINDARRACPATRSLHPHVFLVEEFPIRSDNKNRWSLPGFAPDRTLLTKKEDFSLEGSNLQFDRYFHSILDDESNCFLEIAENAESIRKAIKDRLIPEPESDLIDSASQQLQIVAIELPSEIYRNELFGYFGTLVSSSPLIDEPANTQFSETLQPSPSDTHNSIEWTSDDVISYATEMLTRHLLDAIQPLNEVLYYWAPPLVDVMRLSIKHSIVDWTIKPRNTTPAYPNIPWDLGHLMSFVEVLNGPYLETPIFDTTFGAVDQKKFVGKKWKKAVTLDPRYKFRPYIPVTSYWIWLGSMAQLQSFLPPPIRTICGRITVALIKNDVETGLLHYTAVGEPLLRAVAAFGNFTTIPYFNHLAPRLFPKASSKSQKQESNSLSTASPSIGSLDPVDQIQQWYESPTEESLMNASGNVEVPPRPSKVASALDGSEPSTSNPPAAHTSEQKTRKKTNRVDFRFSQVEGRALPSYLAAYLPILLSEIHVLAKQLSRKSKRVGENYEQAATEHPMRVYLDLVPFMVKDHVEWCAEGTAQALIDAWAIVAPSHRVPTLYGSFATVMANALVVLVPNASSLLRLLRIKPTNPSLRTTALATGLLPNGELGTSFREILVGLFYDYRNPTVGPASYVSMGALARLVGVLDPKYPSAEASSSSTDGVAHLAESSQTLGLGSMGSESSTVPIVRPGKSSSPKGLPRADSSDSLSDSSSGEVVLAPRRYGGAKEKSRAGASVAEEEVHVFNLERHQAHMALKRSEDTADVKKLRAQAAHLVEAIFAPFPPSTIRGRLWVLWQAFDTTKRSAKWLHLATPGLPFLLFPFVTPTMAPSFAPETNNGVYPVLSVSSLFAHPLAAPLGNRLAHCQAMLQSKPLGLELCLSLRFLLPSLAPRAALVQYLLPAQSYPSDFAKSFHLVEGNMKALNLNLDRSGLSGRGWNPPEMYMFLVAALVFMPTYTLPTGKLSPTDKISHLKQVFGVKFMRMYGNAARLMKWTTLEKAYHGFQQGRAQIPPHLKCNGDGLWGLRVDDEVLSRFKDGHPTMPLELKTHWFGVSIVDRVRTLWIDNAPIHLCGGDPNDPSFPRSNAVQFTSPQVQQLLRHHFYIHNLSISKLPFVPKSVRFGFATKEAIQLLSSPEYGLCGIGDIPDSWSVCGTSRAIFREGSTQRTEREFVDQSTTHPIGPYLDTPIVSFYDPITNSFCVRGSMVTASRSSTSNPLTVSSEWVHLPNDRSLTLYPCFSFYSSRRFIYWSDTEDRSLA